MPYGKLEEQLAMRFGSYEDLDKFDCTIEKGKFEPHIDNGMVVFAGVDYGVILKGLKKKPM